MKTISQLLELSKNKYYKLLADEQKVLDDFLAKQREKLSKRSQKKNSTDSSKKINVTVRNIVKPVDTNPPESGQ
jgi:hypothetical protein